MHTVRTAPRGRSAGRPARCTRLLVFMLCAALLGRLRGAEPAVAYGNNPSAGRYYDLRGFRMYTETYGTGRPLLMIHGNAGSMAQFTPIVPYFASRYRVILADSRSQGKSPDPGHPISFEMMADDFDALLGAMHVPAADVIGWSDGGIDALLLALRHPGRVWALASTGANLWPGTDALAPGMWAGIEQDYRDGRDKPRLTEEERNGWKLFMLDYTQPHLTPAELGGIRCPCLIICGDHDIISIEHTALIHRSIPKSQMWVVPDSGHAMLAEHPGEFAGQVDALFARALPGRKD